MLPGVGVQRGRRTRRPRYYQDQVKISKGKGRRRGREIRGGRQGEREAGEEERGKERRRLWVKERQDVEA